MLQDRKAGILLHITSLPSKYGIGTLGADAISFIDYLASCGIKLWQILPLVPTNYGDSPYQGVSSTALNYYLIDYDVLFSKGLLKKKDYSYLNYTKNDKRVNYSLLFKEKIDILKKAFKSFDKNDKKFKSFVKKKEYHNFGIFMTIKSLHNYASWELWSEGFRVYSKTLEESIMNNFKEDYLFWIWSQYEFLEEWNVIHKYASKNNIKIIGDIPFYVDYDSVEVWFHPELFLLDENRKRKVVSACPDDNISNAGQLWKNPIYNFEEMKKDNYKWWNDRIKRSLTLFDILRLDHFRGYDRFYTVSNDTLDIKEGKWLDGPKFDLFKDKLDIPIIIEDLGIIDEGVMDLINKTKYPGMKILEFGFTSENNNPYSPHKYDSNSVCYTNTHDMKTMLQYITELSELDKDTFIKNVKKECELLNVKGKYNSDYNLVYTIIELALASKSSYAIIPIQDLLVEGKDSRMNEPSTVDITNWSYRVSKKSLNVKLKNKIQELIERYNR